jgi:bacterioferritin
MEVPAMAQQTTSKTQEILDSLAVDLAKEHGAIVQYLLHAAQMRDTVLRWSVTSAAREEMWHMEWLVEAIRDRGGTPTLDRDERIFTSEGLVLSLQADVSAEEGALAHYEKTLETIGDTDDPLVRLIERIMDDERHHRTSFNLMADKVGAEGESAFRAKPEASPINAGNVAPMVGLEYQGLLQYLWNKYGSSEKEAAETYFELAINEMRHLNWVASCLGGLGKPQAPPVPKDQVAAVSSDAAAHERADQYEQQAQQLIKSTREKPLGQALTAELGRIDYQHDYHRFVLEQMEKAGGGG